MKLDFDKFDKNLNKTFSQVFFMQKVVFAVWFMIMCAIFYVAWHFISKVW